MSTERDKAIADTATPVKRKPSLDFSVTGLVYTSMMMFMAAAAVNSQANLLFGVFGLMVGILMVSWLVSRSVLTRVAVVREMPDHGIVGQTMTLTYRFTNQRRFWSSLSICLAELEGVEAFTKQPQTYMLHAAPGMTAVVPTEVVLKRRGVYTLDRYQLSTSFPFGFIKRAIERRRKDTLLVNPPLGAVDSKLLSLCRSAEKTGARVRPRQGGHDEFYGVKEFRTGENPRRIYWRRSARTGVLVAKEMTQVAPPRLLLLPDTIIREGTLEEHADVERVIAMTATLASHALEAGMSVGLYAWSGGWVGVQPNRGKRHRRDLLAVLGRLALNREHDTQALLDNSREFLESADTPILLTPRDVQMGLVDHRRGGMLVLSAAAGQSDRWFQFAPEIDFGRCMPPDQQPATRPRTAD